MAAPFLRWAGSKRSHVSALREFVPSSMKRYFEPFLGSGSLFFALEPSVATLGDQLTPLISTYEAVRRDPDAVYEAFRSWPVSKDNYYSVRALAADSETQLAAQFIYLNKTAWNGLYRVNSRGQFNVPYGMPKSSNIVSLGALREASGVLLPARLVNQDFEETLADAQRGDFAFIDPPYVTSHNNNGFIHYNERIFSWADQERLASLCAELARKGVNVLITNAAHDAVRSLYADFHITEYARRSTLAGDPSKRRAVNELIISSFGAKS